MQTRLPWLVVVESPTPSSACPEPHRRPRGGWQARGCAKSMMVKRPRPLTLSPEACVYTMYAILTRASKDPPPAPPPLASCLPPIIPPHGPSVVPEVQHVIIERARGHQLLPPPSSTLITYQLLAIIRGRWWGAGWRPVQPVHAVGHRLVAAVACHGQQPRRRSITSTAAGII